MRNGIFGSILTVVALLAFSPVILAQTAQQSGAAKGKAIPRLPDGKPDLSGNWVLILEPDTPDSFTEEDLRNFIAGEKLFSLEDPPLQPWAMEIYKANRKGTTNPYDRGRHELDPTDFCFPRGLTRSMVPHMRPFEIVHLPGRVYLLFENDHDVRRIYMDGRKHPEGWPFGWMGHSIGWWEGDTLVVDTVGLNDKTWLDRGGTPHSDALHVVERFRRVNHDILEIDFLFSDPKAFTKPWGAKKVYRLRPDWEIVEHIACEEYLELGKFR